MVNWKDLLREYGKSLQELMPKLLKDMKEAKIFDKKDIDKINNAANSSVMVEQLINKLETKGRNAFEILVQCLLRWQPELGNKLIDDFKWSDGMQNNNNTGLKDRMKTESSGELGSTPSTSTDENDKVNTRQGPWEMADNDENGVTNKATENDDSKKGPCEMADNDENGATNKATENDDSKKDPSEHEWEPEQMNIENNFPVQEKGDIEVRLLSPKVIQELLEKQQLDPQNAEKFVERWKHCNVRHLFRNLKDKGQNDAMTCLRVNLPEGSTGPRHYNDEDKAETVDFSQFENAFNAESFLKLANEVCKNSSNVLYLMKQFPYRFPGDIILMMFSTVEKTVGDVYDLLVSCGLELIADEYL